MFDKGDRVELTGLSQGKELLGFEKGMKGTVVSVGKEYPPDYPVIKWDIPINAEEETIKECDSHISRLSKI